MLTLIRFRIGRKEAARGGGGGGWSYCRKKFLRNILEEDDGQKEVKDGENCLRLRTMTDVDPSRVDFLATLLMKRAV